MKHIRIKVTAEAAREHVVSKKGVLQVFVKEPAQGNMANRRAVQLVAKHMEVAPARVKIIAGHHAPNKTLVVSE